MTELSAEQQRLLAARLGGTKPARRPEKPPDIPRHDADAPPLSAGQQALLFEYHRRSDEPVYTVSYSYWIEGPFDADRFIEALRIVVMAHEPLHTGFGSDRRVLTVEEALKVEQVQLDEAAFAATAERRAKRRVDIEHGPLVHALVGQLAGDRHGVVLTMHHISCDAGSLAAFWADLNVAYRGEELPERAVCYADHAVWQRSRVTDDDLQHWIEQLGAEPEVAELSFARPSAGTLNGYVRRQLTVNDAEVGALGTRPFPLFLAAYGVLLQHLGDVAEPTVGVVASTRDHPDTEPLVGYFLAVLPFRLPVGSSTFRCLVDAVETLSAAGLARRHVPFAQIVQRLRDRKIVTDLAHTMFVFDEVHEPQLDGVRIESRVHSNGTAVAPITLFVRRWGAGWEVALEFDGSELDETSAKLFLDCFDIALSKLLANPDQPVNALNFSDGQASELDMIGQPVTAPVLPLCELIVDHGDTQPLAKAVSCGAITISYRELGERADELAHRLRSEGVRQGDRVALIVPRSVEMIVAILGVLRAGAVYVPLDPDHPRDRSERSAAQVAVNLAVVVDSTRGSLQGVTEVAVPVEVDNPTPALQAWRPRLDDPAYVIFTSGSTGTPRGVEVSHHNLAVSTLGRFDVYDDQPERFLLLSNYGFDSSLVGIFWTLVAGGEIVIPADEEVHDFDQVARLVSQHEVSHLLAVPTLYDALLRRAPDRLSSLRVAIVAGEAAPPSLIGRHFTMLPQCQLVNEYGPTETTIWATSYECSPVDADTENVPIGMPVPGSVARVADSADRPLPLGVAGELLIGGLGLTTGYLDDPAATALKFVTEPSGQPMYRTGDRVRRGPAGALEFLGRVDNQLSVGGVRFEPEELESLLSSHPAVSSAIVVLGENARLVAIVESSSTRADLSGVLIELCKSRLPRVLVPTELILVSDLSRTRNGKIDRAAATEHLSAAETLSSAASDIVGRVAAVWAEVLGVATVEGQTDFFDAGGDSLSALRLVEALEAEFGSRVGIGELIEARTPASLAVLLYRSGSSTPANTDLFEELRRVPGSSPVIMLAPGGGNLLAYDALIRSLDEDQAIVGFRLPGADGRSDPVSTIVEQADRILPQLLAMVPPADGFELVGWSTGGLLALELANRLESEGYPVAFIAMIDTIYPGFQMASQPGKADKYRRLFTDGGVSAVRDHARHRLAIRIRESKEMARMRLAERTRDNVDAKVIERQLFEIAFAAAESYRPRVFDGPVVFYGASGTDTARTVVPWGEHFARVEVVIVEGEHAEENAILDAERVGPLARHLQKLLTANH